MSGADERENEPLTEAESGKRRAFFLDRDGVLNEDRGYIARLEDFVLLPGAAEAVAELNRDGWLVVVFTNQSGVARGMLTAERLDEIHARLRAEIAKAGGELTAVYACPHGPVSDCDCRKPKAGMLHRAAAEHNIDLTASVAVGDSPRDIAAGHSAGCKTILVLSGQTRAYNTLSFPDPKPHLVCANLSDAVKQGKDLSTK